MNKKLLWLLLGFGLAILLISCAESDEYTDDLEFDDAYPMQDQDLNDEYEDEYEEEEEEYEDGEFDDDEFIFDEEAADFELEDEDDSFEFEDEPLEDDDSFDFAEIDVCRLVDRDEDSTGGLGFPRSDLNAPGTGTVRIKVLFTDFPDAPATMSPLDVLATAEGAADIFHAMSYGRVTLQFEPIDQWYRMSRPSGDYLPDDLDIYIEEAVALADPDVDFAEADIVYVMASDAIDYDASAYNAMHELYADGVELINVNTSSEDYQDPDFHKVVAHELGHSFGLIDLYEYEADDLHRFAGDFDLMGNLWGDAPEMMAYHRWMLGWLDDEQVYCQFEEDATTYLTPIEEEGGTKAVMIPIGENQLLVVESRRALGYDVNIHETGALVYTIDADIESGAGGIVVYPNEGELKRAAPLSAGETVTVNEVTVTVLESDADGDLVQVTVDYSE